MIPSVAAGIVAAIVTRGVVAWLDARHRAEGVPLELRLARAIARAEAEAEAVDRILAEREQAAA